MRRLWTLWIQVRSSLWFVPTAMLMVGAGLAFALAEWDSVAGEQLERKWPRFFGAGAEGSRTLLAAIATSMITVAGISFSMTMVALSLAANQYSSRVLRNFMRDRSNQFVLGTFVSIFIYCLIVLRTIRAEGREVVPAISVVTGIVLAVFGIMVLIYFIHHVAASIQVSTILAGVAEETLEALKALYPERIGNEQTELEGTEAEHAILNGDGWCPIPATCSGYIQTVDTEALMVYARKHDVLIRLHRAVGDFIGEGACLASVYGRKTPAPKTARQIEDVFGIRSYRTIEQDPGFGIRQMVDIALKALSPGINDPTTAVNCLDHLEPILRDLVGRRIPSPFRYDDGKLRVIVPRPSFEQFIEEMFREMLACARPHFFVLRRMMSLLISVTGETRMACRREVLGRYGRRIAEEGSASLSSADARDLATKLSELNAALLRQGRGPRAKT